MQRFFLNYFLLFAFSIIGNISIYAQAPNEIRLENNFGIKVAKNQIAIAANNKGVLNTGFLPTLTANAGANYNRDDSVTEFPGQLNNEGNPRPELDIYKAESQRFNSSLNANYTIFDGLGRFYNYKTAGFIFGYSH